MLRKASVYGWHVWSSGKGYAWSVYCVNGSEKGRIRCVSARLLFREWQPLILVIVRGGEASNLDVEDKSVAHVENEK